ncbi:dihydroneopterin aldolase [Halomonas cupida]|uniref:7,8-dihydroneopterin aldolase n=2 Tax=Halomonas cupida TaxID=44933 RepID=A0A1M7F7M6_9GAMM|nr:dihydroneopterin aldolase [Halomonas cupida]
MGGVEDSPAQSDILRRSGNSICRPACTSSTIGSLENFNGDIPMDQVLIEALEVDTVIGVYDWERSITQRLSLDLCLATDIRAAAERDDLSLTLDYDAISRRIGRFANEHDFALVETFAERLAAMLSEEFTIAWLRLTIRKPGAVANARAVGVMIERGSRPEMT